MSHPGDSICLLFIFSIAGLHRQEQLPGRFGHLLGKGEAAEQGQRTLKANVDRTKRIELQEKRPFWTLLSQHFACFVVNTA
jgi:hypothetical protein